MKELCSKSLLNDEQTNIVNSYLDQINKAEKHLSSGRDFLNQIRLYGKRLLPEIFKVKFDSVDSFIPHYHEEAIGPNVQLHTRKEVPVNLPIPTLTSDIPIFVHQALTKESPFNRPAMEMIFEDNRMYHKTNKRWLLSYSEDDVLTRLRGKYYIEPELLDKTKELSKFLCKQDNQPSNFYNYERKVAIQALSEATYTNFGTSPILQDDTKFLSDRMSDKFYYQGVIIRSSNEPGGELRMPSSLLLTPGDVFVEQGLVELIMMLKNHSVGFIKKTTIGISI